MTPDQIRKNEEKASPDAHVIEFVTPAAAGKTAGELAQKALNINVVSAAVLEYLSPKDIARFESVSRRTHRNVNDNFDARSRRAAAQANHAIDFLQNTPPANLFGDRGLV